MSSLCPCQSQKQYADCCQPYHLGEAIPQTAEKLMRSRYSAYTLVNIPYIIATTLPAQQLYLNLREMQHWAENTQWDGLEIIEHRPHVSKCHSIVEFNAFFVNNGERQIHHEISLFVYLKNRWYFVDPNTPKLSNKQPCFCGSKQKFKHCCGIL
ncbi:SEC-C motif-containing protein [Nicoletella semolina]|uniref:UPF0225 protein EV693_11224 n=1 Tax=Nicoletella semolina TaxID=271160 RepID=A0A4R2N6A4_9PAST|nr:YchJ family protein [Nicoletella semolina]MDH2925266.1 preprotein translocase subunit SecA [Nicoletella semolina]TCP16351.1 SEC-C motif-containing protein [Nicoletella semolina]